MLQATLTHQQSWGVGGVMYYDGMENEFTSSSQVSEQHRFSLCAGGLKDVYCNRIAAP